MKRTSCTVPLIVVFMVIQNIATGLAASPNTTPHAPPGIIIPKEGLNEWERHFLKCFQPLALVDLENSSVKGITPLLRRCFIALYGLDVTNPNVRSAPVTIEYKIHGKLPDLLQGVRLTRFIVAYRSKARLEVELGSAFCPACWHAILFRGPADEEGNFIPPLPTAGVPDSARTRVFAMEFYRSGRLSGYRDSGIIDGVPHDKDHLVAWDGDGNVIRKGEYKDPPQFRPPPLIPKEK